MCIFIPTLFTCELFICTCIQVFIHNPHLASNPGSRLGGGRLQSAATSGGASEVSLLNIGQQVTSLAAAVIDGEMTLNAEQPGDVLFAGTQTNLLAYNVEQNTDLFYKDVGPRALCKCCVYHTCCFHRVRLAALMKTIASFCSFLMELMCWQLAV